MKRPLPFRLTRTARLCALAILATAPQLAQANTLMDLYHEALEQDQTLQAALHQHDASVEALPQAVASLLPQLSLTGSKERVRSHNISNNQVQQSSNGQFSNTSTGINYYGEESYSVSLNQVVFNWSAFQTVAQANRTVAQAEATLVAAQQSLLYRVADAYFSVLNAQDTLRADIDARNSYKEQLDQSQKKFDVGLAAITDVRNAQASFDSSAATVIADQQSLDSARRSLGQIIGRPVDAIASLRDEIPLVSPNPVAMVDWIAAATHDNPTLLSDEYAAEAARKQIAVYRGNYLPSVSIVGSAGRNKSDYLYGGDSITDSIGLQATWNIFEGGTRRSQVRQATASYEQAIATYEGEKRSVDQTTRDSYEGVISGIAAVKADKQAVISNQTSLEASKVGLKVGTRTEVDVLTAQQSLATAQRTYFQARYTYLRSVLALKQAAGRITEADLAQIDGLLSGGAAPAPSSDDTRALVDQVNATAPAATP